MNHKEFWNKVGQQFVPNIGTLILVFVLLWAQQAGALGFLSPTSSSTTTISYQGRLADSGGTPVNDTVGMTFRIYNAATGGSPLWTEIYPAVIVNDGLFHILLGSTTPLPNSLFSDNDILYLGITAGADSEMTPREQLASAPWALAVPKGAIGTLQLAEGAVTNAQSIVMGPNASVLATTSLEFVNIPGYEITMETTGGPVLLVFQAVIRVSEENGIARLDFSVDGERIGQDSEGGITQIISSASGTVEPGTTFWIVSPPAGEHTFRVQWKSFGETVELNQYAYVAQFAAVELKR